MDLGAGTALRCEHSLFAPDPRTHLRHRWGEWAIDTARTFSIMPGMTDHIFDWDTMRGAIDAHLSADNRLRPPSDAGYEGLMRGWMSEGLCPEEWAARNAQDGASFSGGEHRHADLALDAWVRRLDAILFTHGAVEACRRHYLTAAELEAVLEREAGPF